VAAFWEGFDFLALAQVLPALRTEFGLGKAEAGALFAFANLGTIAAWFLVRQADRWGRRPVLLVTIVGYAVASAASGLASTVVTFAVAQLLARMFLLAEYGTSVVYVAEDVAPDRRGRALAILQGASSMGAILCAALTPILLRAPWGWRTVYFVGLLPLLLIAWARRELPESRCFQARVPTTGGEGAFSILRTSHRATVLRLAVLWLLTYACSNTAVSFWKDFAITERGLTEAQVGVSLAVASLLSMPLLFGSGRLLDQLGRRRGAVVIYLATAVGVVGAYGLRGHVPLTAALLVAIFGVSAVLPVLNTLTTELIPTASRAQAMGVANNLLGRLGYVLAPLAVGWAAEHSSWGAAMRPLTLSLVAALVLLLRWMPETAGRALPE
jgi:putative MFS transporter